MRLSFAACLFSCAFVQQTAFPEWELVYPESQPAIHELEILSTGCNPATRGFLLGSHSGYAIAARFSGSGTELPWTVVKLPVDFDIQEISLIGNRWVVAGDGGRVAVQDIRAEDMSGNVLEGLQFPWLESQLPVQDDIDDLASLGESDVYALAGGKLYRSANSGSTWIHVEGVDNGRHLVAFHDRLYVLEKAESNIIPDVEKPEFPQTVNYCLKVSADGSDWDVPWTIPNIRQTTISGMDVLFTLFDADEIPVEETGRLFVSISSNNSTPLGSQRKKGGFSTIDGETWCDHGSVQTENTLRYYSLDKTEYEPWNPLMVPNERRSFPWPDTASFIHPPSLPRFDSFGIINNTVCGGEQLTFQVLARSSDSDKETFIVQISNDAETRTITLPKRLDSPWNQLLYLNGTYYGYDGNRVHRSEDLTSWSQSSEWPDVNRLIAGEDHVAQYFDDGLVLGDGYLFLPDDINAVVYSPDFDAWCTLRSQYPDQIIEATSANGETREICRFPAAEGDGAYNRLFAHRGNGLLALSRQGAIVRIDASGSFQRLNPWEGIPSHESITTLITTEGENAYILASPLLRTRDWKSFEVIPITNLGNVRNIVEVGDWLYAISESAVYRMPLRDGSAGSNVAKDWRPEP